MIKDHEIQKLIKQPRLFAIRMDNHDIEKVIVSFVEVKLARDKSRSNRAKCPRKPNPQPQ